MIRASADSTKSMSKHKSKNHPPLNLEDQQNEENRFRYISDAAYFIALERGFIDGDPVSDWLAAEKNLNSM